jgi:PAS domain S-box-containing protein
MITSKRLVTINQIASRTELRIDNTISILKILSKDPSITSMPYATLIDDELHGIPENADINRRSVMRAVFDEYGGFQNMLFLLPNGDVYINEPFFFQKNMTVSNFAFRDWYDEVVKTQNVAVSNVVISKSSGKPNVVIAVPVFSQEKLLRGILTGSLNLDLIEERLQELKSYTDERVVLVDDTRTVIADSERILKGQSLTLGIEEIEAALSGESGIITGIINGTEMVVAYHPIKAGPNTWSIISMQPRDQVFSAIDKTVQGSVVLILIIAAVAAISIFTVNRYFQTQFKLRKQAEQISADLTKTHDLLSKSEAKYKNLYRLSPDAIVVFDKNGVITSYNESFKNLFGYQSEEIPGKSIFTIVSDDHLDLAHDYFDEIRKTGILKNKENWLKKKDGTIFPSLFSVGAISGHNGSTEYLSIINDISEIYDTRKKLEEANSTIQKQLEKIKDADKLKDEFSAMITHELKTPLVPIVGYCKMLKKQMLGALTKDQLDAIDEINTSAKRLEVLISDIMDAKKIDMNKLRFNIGEMSVEDLFEGLNSSYSHTLQQQGKEFIINLQAKNLIIQSDKIRLRQVFDNLISNAIKFTPAKNGKIELGCKKEDNRVLFYVKDNGIGIPPDKQASLFKKFYQIDTSLRRPMGGTGLGLAIAKGIVEGLGGKIWVQSDGMTGATFYFEFVI